ncbi:hypothetical protein M8818_000114 [Zalaria obscura]|uniref:Uncharacterized protein n=1 Tax=Zalaria obscura TaxID=2024903 RepID=A0ACC3SR03_9PEZI
MSAPGNISYGEEHTFGGSNIDYNAPATPPRLPLSRLNQRARGHTYSSSLSSEPTTNGVDGTPTHYSPYSSSRGRRSNSSSNFQTATAGNSSRRGAPRLLRRTSSETQHTTRLMHSRGTAGKGSKSSAGSSFDYGYGSVISSNKMPLPRSASMDHTLNTISATIPTEDMGGSILDRGRPIPSVHSTTNTPEIPQEIRDQASDFVRASSMRTLPSVQQLGNSSAVSSNLHQKHLPSQAETPSERPGFFRRMFGSSGRGPSPQSSRYVDLDYAKPRQNSQPNHAHITSQIRPDMNGEAEPTVHELSAGDYPVTPPVEDEDELDIFHSGYTPPLDASLHRSNPLNPRQPGAADPRSGHKTENDAPRMKVKLRKPQHPTLLNNSFLADNSETDNKSIVLPAPGARPSLPWGDSTGSVPTSPTYTPEAEDRPSIDFKRNKRLSIRPAANRTNSDGPFLSETFTDGTSNALVHCTWDSHQTQRAWLFDMENVLKSFFNSIKQEALPLHGFESHRATPQHSQTLSLLPSTLRRTGSVLSKAPSETLSYRGRRPSELQSMTMRWHSKNRSKPKLYPASTLASSRTSFDDGPDVWSPAASSTWSKYSMNKTTTTMSVDKYDGQPADGGGPVARAQSVCGGGGGGAEEA